MTKTFKEVIAGIRTAVLGREVREDIAQMGEYCEQFATSSAQSASAAASSAAGARQSASAAATSASTAAQNASAAGSSAASAQQQANAAASSASVAKQQAGAAEGSAASAQQQANAAAGSAASAKESKRQLENDIVSVTVLTPYGLTTAYGFALETSDGKQLEATVRVIRGTAEAQKAADEAANSAEKAKLVENNVNNFLRDYFFRLTELASDPLITADGNKLETVGGVTLEASVRVIRTAKTLDDAEYLPVSLSLLKRCLGGLTPTPTPSTTTATLGKAVIGQMVLGTT